MFSATLAKETAVDARLGDVEGGFLCGMLHNLGRILVAYYLTDESEEVERLIKQQGLAPEAAQKRVLGMSFEQIGNCYRQTVELLMTLPRNGKS